MMKQEPVPVVRPGGSRWFKISVGDREIRQYLLDIYGIADSIKVQENGQGEA